MTDEQEKLVRFIFSQIRKVRLELDILYKRKKQLETLADQFYVSYLDSLWTKTHAQLNGIYNLISEKYNILKTLETDLLKIVIEDSKPTSS